MNRLIVLSIFFVLLISCKDDLGNDSHKVKFEFLHPNKEFSERMWGQAEDRSDSDVYRYFEQNGGFVRLRYDERQAEVVSETWSFYGLKECDSEYVIEYIDIKKNNHLTRKILGGFDDFFNYENYNMQHFILKNTGTNGILFDCFIKYFKERDDYKLSITYNYLLD